MSPACLARAVKCRLEQQLKLSTVVLGSPTPHHQASENLPSKINALSGVHVEETAISRRTSIHLVLSF